MSFFKFAKNISYCKPRLIDNLKSEKSLNSDFIDFLSSIKDTHTLAHCTPGLSDSFITSQFMIVISCRASLKPLMKYLEISEYNRIHVKKPHTLRLILFNLMYDDVRL